MASESFDGNSMGSHSELDMPLEREAGFFPSDERHFDFPSLKESTDMTVPDPLGDVIDWLGYADISDDVVVKDPPGPRCTAIGTARELHAKAVNMEPGIRPGGGTSSGDTGEPPAFTGRQEASSSRSGLAGYCGIAGDPTGRSSSALEPEEEEWEARQQQTGAAGRLVIYEEGERPKVDFMLRGGCGRRIMVSAVTEGGKAAQAGVKAGDVLVSIDGKKDFNDKSADSVHAMLKGPVMLVFLGFVGKLQAEVRLNYKQKVCGLSTQHQVVFGRPDAPVQVVDEVIFQPGLATLLLATSPPGPRSSAAVRSMSRGRGGAGATGDDGLVDEEPEDILDGEDDKHHGASYPAIIKSNGKAPTVETLAAVYELRGPEARTLVSRALSRARTASPFSTRYLSPAQAGAEEHAKAPRTMAPVIAQFSDRLDGGLAAGPDLMPVRPFRFGLNGGQAQLIEF